ncbi:transporter substrate-binding domain-containing protein, partial [Escherichia coli]|nr:transporter substrate-binding domain-containing protein [Escherichia coli]
TLAALGLTGCYNNEKTTHTKENRLKTEFTEQEQQTLKNNMVAIHSTQNTEAIAQLPQGFKFVNDGYFTVAVGTNSFPPLHVLAEDNQTRIGSEIDIAQLIADSLGLKLQVIPSSWEHWPLGLASGKFDAVLSDIAVTEQRKQKYDFATYRQDMLAFYVPKDSKIQTIKTPDDIAGLKIVVGSGTNQERLLLKWIENNRQKGLDPAQPIYLEDGAAAALALQSGRVDAYLIPNVMGVWQQ